MQRQPRHSATPSPTGEVPEPPLRLRNPTSPAGWYTSLGLLALGGMFYLIVASAQRTARTEERGDLLAAVLLDEGRAIAPIDWQSAWQRQHLLARLVAAATARGIFVQDLQLAADRDDREFVCHNKHYCIVLRPSPRPDATAATGDDLEAEPLEAMAWPTHGISPGHAVFFYPADADPAYSRNLQYAYADDRPERRPPAGIAHRRADANRRLWDYRGFDDERWLLHDRPPTAER